jgi:hypothetical protein
LESEKRMMERERKKEREKTTITISQTAAVVVWVDARQTLGWSSIHSDLVRTAALGTK